MAITPRVYLPGDVKFSDPTGLVWGTGHCALKDAKYGRDPKTMTSIKDFAQFGEYEWRTGRKKTLEITMEGISEEVEALLTGSDLVTGVGDEGYLPEIIGPAVAGVFPALTHIPILEGSEVVRKTSDAEGKVVTERLTFSTVAPVTTTYNIVNATGVITTDAAYVLYAVVNYAHHDAAAGTTLVEDDAAEECVGGELSTLGVVSLRKSQPGDPHHNFIGVFFGGGSEVDTSGFATVNVLVDVWSQECMMGAATNNIARFTERIQVIRQLLRMASANLNREFAIGPMEYPMEATEPDEHKKYFFHTTITVPVYVGGGS